MLTFLVWFSIVSFLSAIILFGNSHFKIAPVTPEKENNIHTKSIESKREKYLIGMSQCNSIEPYRTKMNEELKKSILKYPDFELVIKDGLLDNNKQVSDIESFIQDKYDLIIVSPSETKPITDVIKKAYDSGIPVIILDRKIEGDKFTQFIGGDNVNIGEKAGRWIAHYLGDNGGKVVEITGKVGTSPQKERHEGFLKGIESNSKLQLLESVSSDWLREQAITDMEILLEKYEDIDVVFAHNDVSAEGAYTAAVKANREDDIKFIGIDGLPVKGGGIESILNNRMDVTYLYPTCAKEAIESAYKILVKGEPVQKYVTIDTIEITKDNAYSIYLDSK